MSINPLHIEGRWFKDEHGRVVILRGVNVASNSKVPPFLPFTDVSLFDPLSDWGMNVIRLVLVWEAVEPQPGRYDEDYIDAIAKLVTGAGNRDIHVILDMHQDLFSRYLHGGCGDGAPSWAIRPSIPQDQPANDSRCIAWALGLWDENVHKAFQSFFANVNGVRDRYIEMWRKMASRFADHPAVIGYDLMNEPIGDEITEIAPLWTELAAAVREVDPESIIFVEPNAVSGVGLNYPALPPLHLGNYAYAPHFYSVSMALNDVFRPSEAERAFTIIDAKARELGDIPVLLGEYGMPPTKTHIAHYVQDLYHRLDQYFYAGTQWNYTPAWNEAAFDGWNNEDFSIVDGDGKLRHNFVVRPYPQWVAGIPLKLDVSDQKVFFQWENRPDIASATVLYLPAETLYEGSPFDLTATPSLKCDFDVATQRLTCTATNHGINSIEILRR